MAGARIDGGRRGGLFCCGDEGAGPGKPVTVALLLAGEATADALEADLLARFRVDLLDFYRGRLSYRRVCVLVAHLPADAAVWRVHDPRGGLTRAEVLLAATERRVTVLWATVALVLGQKVTDAQLAGPLDPVAPQDGRATGTRSRRGEPETKSLREIARWMRGG